MLLQMTILLFMAKKYSIIHTLHPTYMTDLPTYLPLPQLVVVLTFKSEHLHHDSLPNGDRGTCSSVSFPGNWWANLTSISYSQEPLPPHPGSKDSRHVLAACRLLHVVGSCSRTLVWTYKLPSSIKPLMALPLALGSLVLNLGKYRLFRPVRCSPTIAQVAKRPRKRLWAWDAGK